MQSFKTLFSESLDLLAEKLAAGGFAYEDKIANTLKQHGLMNKETKTAGSSGDAPDAHINIKGKQHNLEVKQNKGAMMGQLELHHNDEHGWHISPNAKAKYPKTAEHVEKSGFLKHINSQWSKPTGDYHKDLKMGNVYHEVKGVAPIAAHYHSDRKTPYMHIGNQGTFHLQKDSGGIGTTKLSGNTQLRARMKNRGTDKKTGKTKYGALVVMSLKEPNKSSVDLEHHSKDIAAKHA